MKKPYEIRREHFDEYAQPLDAQFYWVQIAANGEVQATSEMYITKSSAKRGVIDAVNRVIIYHLGTGYHDSNYCEYEYKDWSRFATDKTLSKSKTIQ